MQTLEIVSERMLAEKGCEMKIEVHDKIQAPAREVFLLLRDRLSELVPHMPNVERVEIKSREDLKDQTKVTAIWYAKAEIPEVAKKFIKPEYLAWKDQATWSESNLSVEYTLEPPIDLKLYFVKGHNRIVVSDEKSCTLHVSCDANIYPERLPGVPRFMASLAKKPVEDFLRKMLEPNLKNLAKGLNSYFVSRL